MDKLKPCPYCGGKAEISESFGITPAISKWIWIKCSKCNAKIKYAYANDGRKKLIQAWNNRPQLENKPLTMEQLKQMDGEPVWSSTGEWLLIWVYNNKITFIDKWQDVYNTEAYNKTWVAYAHELEAGGE